MTSPDGPLKPVPAEIMSHEALSPSDAYRQAFFDAAFNRGVTQDTLESVIDANCITLLEATLDESDGQIELPPSIHRFLDGLYPGANILIDEVITDDSKGMIKVDVGSPPYTWKTKELDPSVPDEDTLVAPDGVGENRFYSKQIYFDVVNGTVELGKRPDARYHENTGSGLIDLEKWEKISIPPEALVDFPKIPRILLKREFGRISHYTESEDDFFISPPNPSTQEEVPGTQGENEDTLDAITEAHIGLAASLWAMPSQNFYDLAEERFPGKFTSPDEFFSPKTEKPPVVEE